MIILLNAVYELGKLYIKKEHLDEIDVLLDNKKIGEVVLVEFTEDSTGNIYYNKVYQEDYDSKNKIKYLYKKGSSRGTNITPSTLIGKTLETTFNIKFLKWFENNKDNDILFNKLFNVISDNKDEIFNDLNSIVSDINTKDNILISIVINNGDIKYLNDFDEFKQILINDSLKKYYAGKKNIKGNSTCYLCNQEKEVYGLVANAMGFKFSTIDKLGNIPGVMESNQWKLLPICSDCALYLGAGKNFVEKYLNFSEFGLNYYIIPSFLFDSEQSFDKLYRNVQLFESENKLKSDDLVKIENKLYRVIKNMDNVLEFKFLFYKTANSAFDILAYIESVIPSWLNNLYKTQKTISDYDFFHEENLKLIFGKKHTGNFLEILNKNEKYNFCSNNNWYKKLIKDFLFDFSNKIYLDTIVNIISNNKIDYNFLMSKIINVLRMDWRNNNEVIKNYSLKVSVIKSLMLLILLNELNLINGEKNMNSKNEEFSIELILNSPSKKATFLLGVLTRKLMNIQYRELGSTPFYNNLWGLSLNQRKIKKLYPMVINKLREYDAGYMINLEEKISKNLAQSENDWKLSRDETSYYFVLGFTLFNLDKNKDNDGDIDE